MRSVWTLSLLAIVSGCAALEEDARLSILEKWDDGPGLPSYLDKREHSVRVAGSRVDVELACKDSLWMLGCSEVREDLNGFIGERRFIPGFVCGSGGETLYVTMKPLDLRAFSVTAVCYKRYPYPASSRFLDETFCDLLAQILTQQENETVVF